jgi:large subunit ribosomal protein L17
MRHRVKGRHLARTAEHRRALYRNLIAALFEHGRIRTTDAKARAIRPLAERMITLGKRGDLHARRLAVRQLGNGVALERLFGPIAQRFADRPGGYTRMVKAGRRHGDAAPIAYLELLDEAPRLVRAPGGGEEAPEAKGGKTESRGRRGGAGRRPAPEAKASRARAGKTAPESESASGSKSKSKVKAKSSEEPRPKLPRGSTKSQGATGSKRRAKEGGDVD